MSKFACAIQNEAGVESDLMTLCKWVREDLFFFFIHDLKNDNDPVMREDGEICAQFVNSFMLPENRASLVNPEINGAPDSDMIAYLRHLWTKGLNKGTKGKGNIRKNLSVEKTAVYAAINDAFKSK